MIIQKEHVGKMVSRDGGPVLEVIALNGPVFWGRLGQLQYVTVERDSSWEMLRDQIKPSDEIREIQQEIYCGMEEPYQQIAAIKYFLDKNAKVFEK
jgi:hypothetical protein